jgi:hypothetical protein
MTGVVIDTQSTCKTPEESPLDLGHWYIICMYIYIIYTHILYILYCIYYIYIYIYISVPLFQVGPPGYFTHFSITTPIASALKN